MPSPPSGAEARPSRKGMGTPLHTLLFFDTMLTPRIITFAYWLLLLVIGMAGLAVMFESGHPSFGGFATGLAILVGGAFGARVGCELVLVRFRIDEHLRTVAQRL